AQLRRIRDDIGAVVIAVNGAINHIPWADYYFTLDPDRRHLRRLDQRQPGVRYVVAVPPEYGTPSAIHDHAVSPPQGVTYLRRVRAASRTPRRRWTRAPAVGRHAEQRPVAPARPVCAGAPPAPGARHRGRERQPAERDRVFPDREPGEGAQLARWPDRDRRA